MRRRANLPLSAIVTRRLWLLIVRAAFLTVASFAIAFGFLSGTIASGPHDGPKPTDDHNRRSATCSTSWFSLFLRMRSARGRVGKIFSRRLTRLIRFQIEVAVAIASLSDSRA